MPRRTRKRKSRLDAQGLLPEVIRRLLSISDPDELLRQVLKMAKDALGADEVSLMLLDRAGHQLVEHDVVGKKLRPKRLVLRLQDKEGIVGWVASKRKPQIVADVRKDKRYFQIHADVRSEAAVPILSADRLLGVLNFESHKLGYFRKDDLPLLTFLSSQLAIALRMVELDARSRVWQQRLSALHNISRLGGGVVPLEMLLQRVVDTIRLTCGGEYAAVFHGDYKREELVILAQSSARPMHIAVGSRLKFKTGLLGKAFELGETVNVKDVRRDPMYVYQVPGILSEVCVPIRVGDNPVGILDAQAQNVGEYTDDEVMFLETLARFLTPMLKVVKPT